MSIKIFRYEVHILRCTIKNDKKRISLENLINEVEKLKIKNIRDKKIE